MRIKHAFKLLIVPAVMLLGGCGSTWEPTTKDSLATKIGVTADLPEGWTRYTQTNVVALTRDGPLLQTIVVSREAYGADLENTDRTISKDLLPQEAAQVMIDAMAADSERQRFEVLDNRPAEVDGHQGFRIDVAYKTDGDPRTQESIYGILTEEDYIVARYKAPERYYHERSINDFESTVASFKIDPHKETEGDAPKEPPAE